MMTVHKYVVHITDEPRVPMPQGAQVLSVGVQDDLVCIWALVDPAAPYETRPFSMRGTGHPASGLENVPFIGTVMMAGLAGRALVFHVWDGVPE